MTEENRGDTIPPKVFISYSWACQQFATELACALRTDGVDVKFDRWDLKVGDDKFCFMEQCVVDPAIDKVLILSDKTYAQKANNRNGGVGNETSLISADVYEKSQQQKFIPVVIEKDENGNVFLPAYLKSRMYVDFSSRDLTGAEYQNLLRVVYEKDAVPRPSLGTPPTWLTEDPAVLKTSLSIKSDFQATLEPITTSCAEPLSKYEIDVLRYALANQNGCFITGWVDGKFQIGSPAKNRDDVLNRNGDDDTNAEYEAAVKNLVEKRQYAEQLANPSRRYKYYKLLASGRKIIKELLSLADSLSSEARKLLVEISKVSPTFRYSVSFVKYDGGREVVVPPVSQYSDEENRERERALLSLLDVSSLGAQLLASVGVDKWSLLPLGRVLAYIIENEPNV